MVYWSTVSQAGQTGEWWGQCTRRCSSRLAGRCVPLQGPPPATPDLHRRTSEYPPRETAFTYYWCCCNYHIKTAETETESKRIYWQFISKLQIRCDTGRPPPPGWMVRGAPAPHSRLAPTLMCFLTCLYSSVNLLEINHIIYETFVITIIPSTEYWTTMKLHLHSASTRTIWLKYTANITIHCHLYCSTGGTNYHNSIRTTIINSQYNLRLNESGIILLYSQS